MAAIPADVPAKLYESLGMAKRNPEVSRLWILEIAAETLAQFAADQAAAKTSKKANQKDGK